MPVMRNAGRLCLIAAGCMCIAAALAHVACIFGGSSWYLYMGAPPLLVQAAERGNPKLVIMTLFIAMIILVWAAYAFSAAGLFRRLPLTKLALIAISTVLMARGLSYFLTPQWQGWRPDLSQQFMIWSSIICVVMGLCFSVGTWKAWPHLAKLKPDQLDLVK